MLKIKKPDWNTWELMPATTLFQVVALSCDIEPDSLHLTAWDHREGDFQRPPEFERRLKIANAHTDGMGTLKTYDGKGDRQIVRLADFARWADEMGFELPEKFPRQNKPPSTTNSQWPWGDYETELLKHLAAAATKFWKNYDPTDNSTAPTNKQVSSWLEENGVSSRTAEAMASILRADGLPTGPRK